MKRQLTIKNFGPIKDVEVSLKAVNFFIGEQSIGKSTLAKLITILTDHISLCTIIIKGHSMWNSLLKNYDIDIYTEDQYNINYQWEFNETILKLDIKQNSLISTMTKEGKVINDLKKIAKEVLFNKKIIHGEEFDSNLTKALNSKKDEDFYSALKFLVNSLYIPAERMIYSTIYEILPVLYMAKAAIPKNLLKFLMELRNAQSFYSEFNLPLFDVKYKHEDIEDYIIINESNKKYPIRAASSGIQSTLPLLLVLHYAVNERDFSSYVIEEPECNLFPDKQVELLKHIISIIKKEDRILTITTHSPYLLSVMNNILYAGKLKKKYKKKIIDKLPKDIVEFDFSKDNCSVYSLGEKINSKRVYCASILDEETGMIDFNALDFISEKIGNEFNEIENAHLNIINS